MTEKDIVESETREAGSLVVKDHSEPMSLADFGQWLEDNTAGGIADALQQAAFLLCCDVIAQDISKAPLRLRRRTSPTTSEIVMPKEHPVAGLLAIEPNVRHTWPEFTEMSVLWECMTSNSYAVVLRNRRGDPEQLIPVQTGRVRELIEGSDLFYEVTASTQQEQALLGATMLRVPERDMIHVRSRMLDGLDGYSTMTAGKTTLATGKAVNRFFENLFDGEGQLRGIFTRENAGPDDIMDDQAFQRFRQQMKALMNKFRQLTEPVILEGGMKFESISSKPREMQFAEMYSAQIVSVCRLMRVPPHKIFEMNGEKYSNLETSEKMYVTDALVPRCERREARLAKALLTKKERLEYFFEIDRSAMTLRDSQRENERIKTLVERGVIEIDEARAAMGYNALENGQGKVRLVPTNMNLVDKDGKVVVAGSSTAKPEDETPTDAPAEGETEEKPTKDATVLQLVRP